MFNPVRVCLPLCSTEWKMEGLGDMFWQPVLIHPVSGVSLPQQHWSYYFHQHQSHTIMLTLILQPTNYFIKMQEGVLC